MLSIILYGRNDNYGYNLHKRAAISLNCMAEVLTASGDEIIFVDYNTPDDFPTFPEAIQDTLTTRAQALLRILRVRPSQHERFRDRTELVALEPIARNVAVRRSNPNNRWILSTNTDMVFVPRRGASLSEIAAGLPDAYYHLPRFEIPESLWESLDRLDPVQAIATIGAWGHAFHLNEIVHSDRPEIKYDGPGDFQLILRSDLWRIHGFHESMLLGWHVDSNVAKRLSYLRAIGDVVDDVFGYHCDHTRQVTPAHGARAQQNDFKTFVDDVKGADVPEQSKTWGLADEYVEELKADTTSHEYLVGLRSSILAPLIEPTQLAYSDPMYNRIDYSVDHVLPFLVDVFASYPRDTIVGWLGAKKSLLSRFVAIWKALRFSQPIMVFETADWLGPELPAGCTWAADDVLDERCQVFLFDFGRPERENAAAVWDFRTDAVTQNVARGFRRMIKRERLRVAADSWTPRRFVGVNAIFNDAEALFNAEVGAARSPIETRIRQGFVSKELQEFAQFGEFDCTPMLSIGAAGFRARAKQGPHRDAIYAKPGVAGWVTFGPYISFEPGHYEAAFEFYAERAGRGAVLRIEVTADKGNRIFVQRRVMPHRRLRRFERALKAHQGPLTCILEFDVEADTRKGSDELLEFRVWSPGTIEFCLAALRVRQVAASSQVAEGTVAARDTVARSP